mmetsp:Transcript_46521/g.149332  ORF Transcript_46521/g.149332 Transcript_46521/m.149332 type:complete len:586 (+) Transcript_46521:405-2162(+)
MASHLLGCLLAAALLAEGGAVYQFYNPTALVSVSCAPGATPIHGAGFTCRSQEALDCLWNDSKFKCAELQPSLLKLGHCTDRPCWEYPQFGISAPCVDIPKWWYHCGECPPGTMGDGNTCTPVMKCFTLPCHYLTACIEVPGSPRGFTCTACPAGFVGDGVGSEGCMDVDECRQSPCDPLTTCTNTEGGYSCSDCPAGHRGHGDLLGGSRGCQPISPCEENNGGCDPASTCEPSLLVTSVCRGCPPGFEGIGDTWCRDKDGCKENTCFKEAGGSAVRAPCTDLPGGAGYNPLATHSCGACPVGYSGNGRNCKPCPIALEVSEARTVDGPSLPFPGTVEVLAAPAGGVGVLLLSQGLEIDVESTVDGACTSEGGLVFRWRVSSVDPTFKLQLTPEEHGSDTLSLRIPPLSFHPGLDYNFTLRACYAGNYARCSEMVYRVQTHNSYLLPVITGGSVVVGEASQFVLDGAASIDPDGTWGGEMTYTWHCREKGPAGGECIDASGGVLVPPTGPDAKYLRTRLLANADTNGTDYVFTLEVTKADERFASVSADVRVVPFDAPSVRISPISLEGSGSSVAWDHAPRPSGQ